MTLELSHPVAAYFAADKVDGEQVARCFTDDAVVQDEGHAYRGRAAIAQWKTDASAKFQYECKPLACEHRDGKTIVTSRVTGNFPGSPVELQFCFTIQGDKLSSLEVIPR